MWLIYCFQPINSWKLMQLRFESNWLQGSARSGVLHDCDPTSTGRPHCINYIIFNFQSLYVILAPMTTASTITLKLTLQRVNLLLSLKIYRTRPNKHSWYWRRDWKFHCFSQYPFVFCYVFYAFSLFSDSLLFRYIFLNGYNPILQIYNIFV